MSKTCTNCPGATDHDTAHCPMMGERVAFDAAYERGDFYFEEQRSEIQYQDYRRHQAWTAFRLGWQARAALVQPSPELERVAVVKGYHCAGDGGGGTFYEEAPTAVYVPDSGKVYVEVNRNLSQTEGAQGEREMREAFEQARDCDGLDFIDGEYWLRPIPECPDELASVNPDWWLWKEAWKQSRAALAQPSPAPELERPGRKLGMTALINEAKVLMAERDAAQARVAELEKQEPVEFDYPEFHEQGMGCGLEDRGITDRYEAMRYGFDEAVDQFARIIESLGPLYAAPVAQAGQVPVCAELLFKLEAQEPGALDELRSELYKGHAQHWSDCATNSLSCPELLGPCDCGGYKEGEA